MAEEERSRGDGLSSKGGVCPLLAAGAAYVPDSLDLVADEEARAYWLPCLGQMVGKFVRRAERLHPGDATATPRAQQSHDQFHQVIARLRDDPMSHCRPLSIRTLLELNEAFLRQSGFVDAWRLQKQEETRAALAQLQARLREVDGIDEARRRWEQLCKGVVAGNMFDWGATAVTEILEAADDFGLGSALARIQARPWLIDHLDEWLDRLQGPVHKNIVMFIDNAGIDLVLGVLPLVREFVRRGSCVILAANSRPALNDVTHPELVQTLAAAAAQCAVLAEALAQDRIRCLESGQEGPCLDLSNLHPELCSTMSSADLVILEGMGRAIHTNLHARLTVDCLKLAVIKNEWLAKRLGGDKFSVLFQFEPGLL